MFRCSNDVFTFTHLPENRFLKAGPSFTLSVLQNLAHQCPLPEEVFILQSRSRLDDTMSGSRTRYDDRYDEREYREDRESQSRRRSDSRDEYPEDGERRSRPRSDSREGSRHHRSHSRSRPNRVDAIKEKVGNGAHRVQDGWKKQDTSTKVMVGALAALSAAAVAYDQKDNIKRGGEKAVAKVRGSGEHRSRSGGSGGHRSRREDEYNDRDRY